MKATKAKRRLHLKNMDIDGCLDFRYFIDTNKARDMICDRIYRPVRIQVAERIHWVVYEDLKKKGF